MIINNVSVDKTKEQGEIILIIIGE